MKRKLPISSVVALVLMAILLTFLVTDFAVAEQFNQKLKELDGERVEFQKLATLDAIIREHYALKTDDVNQSEGAISGYVEGIGDGYSRYLSADEYAEHTVLSYDVSAQQMKDWARMMDIEFVHITEDTTVEALEKELFLNDLAWKLK